MRSAFRLLLLTAAIGVAGTAWADSPHPIDYCFHDPNDLKAYDPPGPSLGTDGTGDISVEPPRKLDPALLNDPDQVRWPTLDKSEWEKLKGSYQITPCK